MVLIIGISVSRELVAFTLHKLNTLFPKRARARTSRQSAWAHTCILRRICLLSLNISNSTILHFLPPYFFVAQPTIGQKIINASLAHHSPPLSLFLPYIFICLPRGTHSPIRTNDEGPRRFCKKAHGRRARACPIMCDT